MSTTTQQLPGQSTTIERRFYSRIVPQVPVYVTIEEMNESLLLNVSENGLLLSTPSELPCNFVSHIALPLNGLPKPVQVTIRVVWASEVRKLAGIQLLNLSEYDRQQIRRWGAQASVIPALQRESHPSRVVKSFTAPLERKPTAPSPPEKPRLTSPPPVAFTTSKPPVQTRPASSITRRMKWPLLLAALCVAGVFLLRSGALGNPFAHSEESPQEAEDSVPAVQNSQPSPPNTGTAAPNFLGEVAWPPSAADTAQTNSTPASKPSLLNSEKVAEDHTETVVRQDRPLNSPASPVFSSKHTDERESAQDTSSVAGSNPGGAQNNPSPSPVLIRSAPNANSTSADSTASIDMETDNKPEKILPTTPTRPSVTEALRVPMHSNSFSGSSTIIPSKPNVVTANPVPPLNSAPAVIQMDALPRQLMEVHLPGGYRASFFNVPGERVLQSSATTMRIQRSVHLPETHAVWPFHRDKKVLMGQLISRIDPQVTPAQLGLRDFVRVRATVAEDGRIASVTSLQGPPNLVPAVAKAIHEWRYQPTLVDGKPVETQADVVVQFHVPATRAVRP
jgi:hypothetical protein